MSRINGGKMKIGAIITLLIAMALLATIALGMALNPGIETTLPGDATSGAAGFSQHSPVISRGGDGYLTAWVDYRTNGTHLSTEQSRADIFAARLDASGNLVDMAPIPISLAGGDEASPVIAWNGDNWLVAWLSQTPNQFYWSMEVMAVRVSPAGQVLDPAPISIYKYPWSSSAELALASDGDNWLAVTRGDSAGEDSIIGVRIAPDGTVLDPGGAVLVPGTGSLAFYLDLTFAIDEYLLTYLQYGNVFGLRVDSSLQPIDPSPFQITDSYLSLESARVATNGSDFFVSWREYNNGTQYGEARGTRISYAGEVLDPGGLAISGLMYIGALDPRVTWDGLNWLVTFRGLSMPDDDLRAARVTTAGVVLDYGGAYIEPTGTYYAEVEITGAVNGGTQIVWQDERSGGFNPYDISTFSINQELVPSDPVVASYSTPAQTKINLATSGNGYMLVYLSTISPARRIMVHPLDAEGNALLDEPVMLDSGPYLNDPSVAWNGSLYFVVWMDQDPVIITNSVIYGQRILADGTPLDPAPFAIMEGYNPDVAAAGDLFLVVAIHQQESHHYHGPIGVRVQGSDGAILDPTPLDLGDSYTRVVSVAGLGDRWLLSYQCNFSHDDPHSAIMATFVELNGSSPGTFPIAGTQGTYLYDPDVASDGTDAIVVWETLNPYDLQGARVLSDGSVEPAFTVSDAPQAQENPAIAWEGTQYVVLYQDSRANDFFLDYRSDIYGTRLDANGNILDPQGFSIWYASVPEIHPALAGTNNVALIASAIFKDIPPHMSYRVEVSLMGDVPPTPTPTETGTPTQSSTPTSSPTPTGTATPTGNVTPTSSPTPTATIPPAEEPTATQTPTPTQTLPGSPEVIIYLPLVRR